MMLPTKMKCWSQQMIFRTTLTVWHVLAVPASVWIWLQNLIYLYFMRNICPKRWCFSFNILLYYSSEHTSPRIPSAACLFTSEKYVKKKKGIFTYFCLYVSSHQTVRRFENSKMKCIFIFSWMWPFKVPVIPLDSFKIWHL